MIKLIITSDSSPVVTRRFNQPSMIIGGEHSTHADLKLASRTLEDRHILISTQMEKDKTCFFITNLANDPFVTLNNLPFGKQPLYGNDLIQAGDFSLRFEYDLEPTHEEPLFPEPLSLTNHNPAQPSHSQKLSLKNYYLSEYDDDEESSHRPLENINHFRSPQFAKSWRTSLTFFGGFLGIIVLISSIFYLWVSDQTSEEEIKAAKGVADIAMSLTYAHLKHIHPQNQNWSDPEFIRNNLTPILAPGYISMTEVDAHGQFNDCPYLLRIYTSSDLSQFLVIAQPSPSLLQWLIPKASIIVDSRVMEMRKITDLKALNRLIVNSNSLDSVNTNEISNLVKQGELIPLAFLISKAENQGLAPPKALGLLRPGAENFVYNAPRYYLLGEALLNSSLSLADKHLDKKETGMLQQELNSLMKFPDFILYSSNGIRYALKAQKALSTLKAADKFLIAYLQLNSHGKIANTHLLIDDKKAPLEELENKPSDLAAGEKITLHQESVSQINPINENTFQQTKEMANEATARNSQGPLKEILPFEETDIPHPLFLQLSTIVNLRQSILKPIAEEMIELLKKQTAAPQLEFTTRFATLQQKFQEADLEQQDKIFKKFAFLTLENKDLPAEKFSELIKAASLNNLFKNYLSNIREEKKDLISDEEIEEQFQKIQKSTTWKELESQTIKINEFLQFDHMPEESRLIAFQNTTRALVIKKLNHFIISSTEALPSNASDNDSLQILSNILKAVWITDPETYDFYITQLN